MARPTNSKVVFVKSLSLKKRFYLVFNKFPNNYRLITESFPLKKLTYGLFLVAGFFLIIGIGGIATASYTKPKPVSTQQQVLQKDLNYWKTVVEHYPGFRDGYFQLAVLSYKLGDKNGAKQYVEQALTLDPNFSEGLRLKASLQ